MKGGIVFFRSHALKEVVTFYIERLGMEIWHKQPDCTILKFGGLLLGFCQREVEETEGTITFFYDTKEEVDKVYMELRDISTTQPFVNPKYNIYHFFACDPEGRSIEVQSFVQPIGQVT
jgi:hypothetical protein